jgi:hypothetical protein
MPARTGRLSSAKGAERKATRAARPPLRDFNWMVSDMRASESGESADTAPKPLSDQSAITVVIDRSLRLGQSDCYADRIDRNLP